MKLNHDRIKCRLCGKWFISLGTHVWRTHGWTADDYREEFGLNRNHGLISNSLREMMSDYATKHHFGERLRPWRLSGCPPWLNGRPPARAEEVERRVGVLFQPSVRERCYQNLITSPKAKEAMRRNIRKAQKLSPANKPGRSPEITEKVRVALKGQHRTAEQIEHMKEGFQQRGVEWRARLSAAAERRYDREGRPGSSVFLVKCSQCGQFFEATHKTRHLGRAPIFCSLSCSSRYRWQRQKQCSEGEP